jgi:hypothetical protein
VSILTNDPEGGGHAFFRNIFGAQARQDAGGDRFSLKNFTNEGKEIGGGGFRLIDRQEKGSLGGEQRKAGKKEGFELSMDAEGAATSPMGEGGGIENDGIESFAPACQAGEDFADILRPKPVRRSTELISLVVTFAAGKGASGGVDVEGFRTNGGG